MMPKINEIFTNPLTVAIVIVLAMLAIGTQHIIYAQRLDFHEARIKDVERDIKASDARLLRIEVGLAEMKGDTKVIISQLTAIQRNYEKHKE